MILEDLLYITSEEWHFLADNIHDYLSIKTMVENGRQVALKDNHGNVYAYLKIDEINKMKYIYLRNIDSDN